MSLNSVAVFVFIVSLFGISTAGSCNRGCQSSAVPVAIIDQCPSKAQPDLNSLLLYSKLLQQDAPCASYTEEPQYDIDVEGIINKLLNALLYTTSKTQSRPTLGSGCGCAGSSYSSSSQGVVPDLLSALL